MHGNRQQPRLQQPPAHAAVVGPVPPACVHDAPSVFVSVQTSWRIYKDPDNALTNSTSRRAFWSAFSTFNLAIMGGSVLPMPYAMSKTGVLVGMLTMVLVALCNDYTTCLTISAAYTTGLDSFEALAYWAGGKHWKVGTGECMAPFVCKGCMHAASQGAMQRSNDVLCAVWWF